MAEGAEAYQAGRDVTVNNGITIQQMGEILSALSAHVSVFRDEALAVANSRIAEFEQKVLEKFVDEKQADREAFKQPDFIAMLGKAQEQFVRADDQNIGETLVDLIARRSQEPKRGRAALTLNDAILRVGNLTAEELAGMSVAFLVRSTTSPGVYNIATLAVWISSAHLKFVGDLADEFSSFLHIQSQGCGYLDHLTAPNLIDALKQQHPLSFSAGFTREQLCTLLPADKADTLNGWIEPHWLNSERFMFRVPRAVLDHFLPRLLPAGPSVDELVNLAQTEQITHEAFAIEMEKQAPGFSALKEKWDTTGLKSLILNSVGIAIAHANCKRVFALDAPLEIWIK